MTMDKCQKDDRDEFEKYYAALTGQTREFVFHVMGRIAIPCACGAGHCRGWRVFDRRDAVALHQGQARV
jgi:hypothetical protein